MSDPVDQAPDDGGMGVDQALEAAMSDPVDPDGDPAADLDPGGDPGGDPLADPGADQGTSWDDQLMSSLTRSPSKSLHDIDQSEYFDPEAGGTNRMLLVLDDVVTQGDGLQNWMHLLVAAVEITVSDVIDDDDETDEQSRDDTHENTETELSETDGSHDLEVR